MDRLALHDGATAAFDLVNEVNNHLQKEAPWALVKDPAKAAAFDRVMWESAEALRIATILLHPVMPRVTARVLERLGRPAAPSLEQAAWGTGDFTTSAGDALFPRIEDPAKKKPAKS
jgi:methionyl-tRNA synthetase